MASNNAQQGVKVFTATVFEALEDKINQFLNGASTPEDQQKELVFAPTVFLSGGTFYAVTYYRVT